MASLYSIDQQLLNLLMLDEETAVDQETGEVFTKEAIDQLVMDRREKLENCLLFVKNEEAMVEAIDAEIAALKARKEQHLKRAERASGYVQDSLNGDKFETAKVAVKYTKSEKVELVDTLDEVPEEYLRYKPAPPPELDKVLVKKVIKAGGMVRGCRLVTATNMKVK